MKVRDIMSQPAIHINPGESVEVAARTLTHYNIGFLPVCSGGQLRGVVTDRDMVIRCVASGRKPSETMVRDVMTGKVEQVQPDMEASVAAHLMGRKRVRRLPVVEHGRVKGILSLDDLAANEQNAYDAADALGEICAYFLQNKC